MSGATIANQANAVTGVYGISGSGKSNLADTGAEWGWETFKKITLCYAADLGGFGNKRLALIRAGIMRVYDPRNHVNPFETMELISLGAWPEEVLDPERGYADPTVKLILPRQPQLRMICPQGHVAGTFTNEAILNASQVECPECHVLTNTSNCARVERAIIRPAMFAHVGGRIYDSMTALNEWGMQDLQEQSAKGTLPSGNSGGSLLGSADALRSGQFMFGSSSISQYGFVQNRTYGWLSNIRKIPDQVMPAIATFHVEQSKGNDESGGDMLLGPKIAGNARTAALPGWLGNCLHATKEPYSAENPVLVYRLWLTNHIDVRDPRKIPYVAKHRGTPLGMPDYLEDKPGDAPWSGFSLKVLFNKLQTQLQTLEADARTAYPDAPAFAAPGTSGAAQDEVISEVVAAPVAGAGVAVAVGGGRSIRRRGAVAPPVVPVIPVVPPPPVAVAVPSETPAVLPPSPIHQQLEASLAAAGTPTPVPVSPSVAPPAAGVSASAAPVVAAPAASSTTRRPVRRVPRPPVG